MSDKTEDVYRDPPATQCADGGSHVNDPDMFIHDTPLHIDRMPPLEQHEGAFVLSVCRKCRTLYVDQVPWAEAHARTKEYGRRFLEWDAEQRRKREAG